ncbi:MAG: proline dehydrogenase family protein [Planctomycetota bacterium]|nr:proline dehydrogenase family protein [Planctomycetota bacterium]
MALLTNTVVGLLGLMPKPVMRRFAARYIAGETIAEALARLKELNDEGFSGVLDILGEDAEGEAGARAALAEYLGALEALHASGLDAYVSAKPTHFGLRTSEDLAFELYSKLATACAERGRFLRVEMEDHTTTEATLSVFERLVQHHDNVGIVLQSRLFRNDDDIARLLDSLPEGRVLDVRMVKGIYLEPAKIAHTEYAPIAEAYVRHCRLLFEGGARISLATHDEVMAERLFELIRELEVPTERYELQVLMGVRRWLWLQWLAAGHPVRVYVPYGPEWRPYSLRRLKKNPKLLSNFVKGFFGG